MAREYPKGTRDTWSPGTKGWDAKHATDSRSGYTKAHQFANGGMVPNVTKSPFTTENQGSREYPKAERKISQKSELTQHFSRGGKMVEHFDLGGAAGDDGSGSGTGGGGNPADAAQGMGNMGSSSAYGGGGYGGGYGDVSGPAGNPADQAQGLGNMGASEAYGGGFGSNGGYGAVSGGSGYGGGSGGGDFTGGGMVGSGFSEGNGGTGFSDSGFGNNGGSMGDRPSWARDSAQFSPGGNIRDGTNPGGFAGGGSNVSGPGPAPTADPMSTNGFRATGAVDNPEPDWNTFNQDHLPSKYVKDEFGNLVDPTTIRNAVYNAANRHGVDPQAAFDVVQRESSFRPTARNGSYQGIAQIGDKFAKDYNVQDPNDYQEALDASMGAMADKRNRMAAMGIHATEGDMYMSHQQGMTGASRMAKADPDSLAKSVTSRENIGQNMPPGAREKGLTPDNITAQQFRSEWEHALKTK